MNRDLPPGVEKPKLAHRPTVFGEWVCHDRTGDAICVGWWGDYPSTAYRSWFNAAWRRYWIRLDQRVREATA